MSYRAFLAAPETLAARLRPGDALRLESPDRDRADLRALYDAGRAASEASGAATLAGPALEDALSRVGAIGSPSQLAFGLEAASAQAARIAAAAGARITATPEEVALAYDKSACLARLRALGAPTPQPLGGPVSFEDLIARMRRAGVARAFVKLRHGSAAAGMLALALGRDRILAHSTALLGGDGRLYATRRVRRLERPGDIEPLVNALAPLGLHAERWVPKAGLEGRAVDLRLVVIGGDTVVPILRMGDGPMTNLHLGARRADASLLAARLQPGAWAAILETARRVANGFGGLASVGIDLAPLADFRRHAVLEVNAFGDFVKGAVAQGLDPAEHLVRRLAPRQAISSAGGR